MAVLDQLKRMEQEVAARLRELEPLVAEHEELKRVAQRLGLGQPGAKAATSRGRRTRRAASGRATAAPKAQAKKPARSTTRRASGGRAGGRRNAAAPGSRQQEVLRLVNERPGISVPELGKELGVDPTGLYQIVRRLEGRGVVRKEGRQLQPVAGASDTAGEGEGASPAA